MLFFLFLSGNYSNKYFHIYYVRGFSEVECYLYLYVRHIYGFWVQNPDWTYFISVCKILSTITIIEFIIKYTVFIGVISVSKLEDVFSLMLLLLYIICDYVCWLSFLNDLLFDAFNPSYSSHNYKNNHLLWLFWHESFSSIII